MLKHKITIGEDKQNIDMDLKISFNVGPTTSASEFLNQSIQKIKETLPTTSDFQIIMALTIYKQFTGKSMTRQQISQCTGISNRYLLTRLTWLEESGSITVKKEHKQYLYSV